MVTKQETSIFDDFDLSFSFFWGPMHHWKHLYGHVIHQIDSSSVSRLKLLVGNHRPCASSGVARSSTRSLSLDTEEEWHER